MMLAVAYIRMFGLRDKQTPEGHPILIGSAPFDLDTTKPEDALLTAIAKWHEVAASAADLRLVQEYDVLPEVKASHRKVFYFEYLPERELLASRDLSGKVVNYFEESWYLKKVTTA